jgi:hypothetical protein
MNFLIGIFITYVLYLENKPVVKHRVPSLDAAANLTKNRDSEGNSEISEGTVGLAEYQRLMEEAERDDPLMV